MEVVIVTVSNVHMYCEFLCLFKHNHSNLVQHYHIGKLRVSSWNVKKLQFSYMYPNYLFTCDKPTVVFVSSIG